MHGGLSVHSIYEWDGNDDDDDGRPMVWENQEIRLSANCNEACIRLFDEAVLTPEFLRRLADEIEKGRERAVVAAEAHCVQKLATALKK
jgi:hypothetical protein